MPEISDSMRSPGALADALQDLLRRLIDKTTGGPSHGKGWRTVAGRLHFGAAQVLQNNSGKRDKLPTEPSTSSYARCVKCLTHTERTHAVSFSHAYRNAPPEVCRQA